MKIEKIEIKGLFGKKDICWELNPQVNVLVGVNGSGKSTILSIIYSILGVRPNQENMELFDTTTIIFDNTERGFYISSKRIFPIPSYPVEEKEDKYDFFPMRDLGSHIEISVQIPEKIIVANLEAIEENLYFDLIEANLTNSNANHIIQKSNQQMGNVLDLEIRDTIHELNKIKTDDLISRLSGSLNVFFNQIGKHVFYENDELVYRDIQLNKTLNYSDLSSGERQLIYILLRVALSNGDKSKTTIMLMDEPEISLHLDWQEHFIKQLTVLNPDAQFIIVTHSPALIMNGWNDVYTDMEDITTWL